MKWLLNALSSSVGRKFVMAITGLLLCGFLVAHLAGNLLLWVSAEAYNDYAHKLHEQALLLAVAETGLFALFIIHIVLAFRLTIGNNSARGQGYAVQKAKGEGDGFGFGRPDTWMAISGTIVLGYICLHLIDFKFELRGSQFYEDAHGNELLPAAKAEALLKTGTSTIGYLAGIVFLTLHLMHGIPSLFQSLGINHKKYNDLIRKSGLLIAVAIGAGFASFLFWAHSRPPAKPEAVHLKPAAEPAPAVTEPEPPKADAAPAEAVKES